MENNLVYIPEEKSIESTIPLASGETAKLYVVLKKRNTETGEVADPSAVLVAVVTDAKNTLEAFPGDETEISSHGKVADYDVQYKVEFSINESLRDPKMKILLETGAFVEINEQLRITDRLTDKFLKDNNIPYSFFFQDKYKDVFYTKTGAPLTEDNLKSWLCNHTK